MAESPSASTVLITFWWCGVFVWLGSRAGRHEVGVYRSFFFSPRHFIMFLRFFATSRQGPTSAQDSCYTELMRYWASTSNLRDIALRSSFDNGQYRAAGGVQRRTSTSVYRLLTHKGSIGLLRATAWAIWRGAPGTFEMKGIIRL